MSIFLDFLFYSGIVINLIILWVVFKNGQTEFHQKVLFGIFLFISLSQISTLGFYKENAYLFFPFFVFDHAIIAFIGPIFLLYVKSIFLPTNNLAKRNLKHFVIPFLFLIFISIPLLISLIKEQFVFNYLRYLQDYMHFAIGYSLLYCFFALQFVRKAKKVLLQHYSTVDVLWIKQFLIGAILLIIVDIGTTFYELFFSDLPSYLNYLTSIGVVFLVFYLAYKGVVQSKILLPYFLLKKHNLILENDSSEILQEKEAVQKNPQYDEKEMLLLKQKLQELIQKEKPYLDPELSLKSLANLLSIPERKMSTLLNQYLNTSFYDYINGLRIEEFKHKIENYSHKNYTLLAIAYECGFSSKTSFNRVFNKMVNMSPSAYKKKILSP